jgi:hypothetical protein
MAIDNRPLTSLLDKKSLIKAMGFGCCIGGVGSTLLLDKKRSRKRGIIEYGEYRRYLSRIMLMDLFNKPLVSVSLESKNETTFVDKQHRSPGRPKMMIFHGEFAEKLGVRTRFFSTAHKLSKRLIRPSNNLPKGQCGGEPYSAANRS